MSDDTRLQTYRAFDGEGKPVVAPLRRYRPRNQSGDIWETMYLDQYGEFVLAGDYLKLLDRLAAAESLLDDIACEKQNLHGRIDDSDLAHEICDRASQYFINKQPRGQEGAT